MTFPLFIAPAPLYRAISLGIVIGGEGSRVSSNAIYRRDKEAAENVYARRVFLFSFFFVFFRPTFPCVRSRWTSPSVLLHTSALSVSLSLCVFFFF